MAIQFTDQPRRRLVTDNQSYAIAIFPLYTQIGLLHEGRYLASITLETTQLLSMLEYATHRGNCEFEGSEMGQLFHLSATAKNLLSCSGTSEMDISTVNIPLLAAELAEVIKGFLVISPIPNKWPETQLTGQTTYISSRNGRLTNG